MKKIVYYVAASLDGFIAGPAGDVSAFKHEGESVNAYKQDLLNFETVIMGRHTYEFGYQFGLKSGQPAYPHMKHYVFSNQLNFENPHPNVKACPLNVGIVQELKQTSPSNIYLCGGGQLAGWLLENQLIDQLKIKLNPIILGEGIKLFGSYNPSVKLRLSESQTFKDKSQINDYQLVY